MFTPSDSSGIHVVTRISAVMAIVGVICLGMVSPSFAQDDPNASETNSTHLYLPTLSNGKEGVEPTQEASEEEVDVVPQPAVDEAALAADAVNDSVSIAALPVGLSGEGGQIFFQGQDGIPNTVGASEFTGAAVAAGDFNGDGNMDLAAGVPNEGGSGGVLILYGTPLGLSAKGSRIIDASSLDLPAGQPPLKGFGTSVAAGDFNSDGYADLVVGSPGTEAGGFDAAGAVLILYGSVNGISTTGRQLFEQSQEEVAGNVQGFGEELGVSVATGDFNGDGYADVAAGANGDYESGKRAGAVLLLYGSPSGITANGSQILTELTRGEEGSPNDGDQLGRAVAAGDLNSDGYSDLVIGIQWKAETQGTFPNLGAGALLVLYGSPDGIISLGNQFFAAPQGYDSRDTEYALMGSSLATGDFDGDGYADVATGAPLYSGTTGAVVVYHGGPNGLNFRLTMRRGDDILGGTSESQEDLGRALAAGDFNDDGYADLAIGAPGRDIPFIYPRTGVVSDAGIVIVVYGSSTGLQGQGRQDFGQNDLENAEAYDQFGRALAGGDFNGDGHSDLVVGVPNEDSPLTGPRGSISAEDAGALMVLYAYAPNVIEVSTTGTTGLDPIGVEGQPVADLPTFLLWNGTGGRHLYWRAQTDVPWLSLAYTDALRVPISVTVGIDTNGLAQGVHLGHITLFGRRSDEISKTIAVTLTLVDGGSPLLSVSPPLVQFAVSRGAAVPVTGTLVVRNLGPGSLTWNASVTAGSAWLEISGSNSGTADGFGSQVIIRPKGLAALAPGTHVGQVTFTSPDAAGTLQRVQVVIHVPAPPSLTVNSRQRIFNAMYEDGQPPTQTVLIGNSGGGGSIPWSATATEQTGSDWLRLGSSTGTTPGQLGVTVDTSKLTLGQVYQGQIQITSPNAQGSPQVLNVTLKYGTNLRFAPKPDAISFFVVRGAAAPPGQMITIAAQRR